MIQGRYLRGRKIRFTEVPPGEFSKAGARNLVTLEPGKVVIPAETKQTIAAPKKKGVRVC